MNLSHQIPILIITFNRPENTKLLIKKITEFCENPKIYFFADHPRINNENDIKKCAENKNIIMNSPSYLPERFLTNNENLGCRLSIIKAISWFFEREDSGIILEDDCIPSKSFIDFCHKALDKYKNDAKVFNICGTFYGKNVSNSDYYLSTLNGIWGWATWKRSWESIDFNMSLYKSERFNAQAKRYFKNRQIRRWTLSYIDDQYCKRSNIWSPYLMYTKIINGSYTLTPEINLVENVGLLSGVNSSGNDFMELSTFRAESFNLEKLKSDHYELKEKLSADIDSFKIIAAGDPRMSWKISLHRLISNFLYQTKLIKIYHFIKKL